MAQRQPDSGPRVGLALAGGGARGLAQIGVLRVLEREGIPVAAIAGTSMGAIVGGLYAMLADADAVEERVRTALASPQVAGVGLGRVFGFSGIVTGEDTASPDSGPWAWLRDLLGRLRIARAAMTRRAILPGPAVLQVFERIFEGREFGDLRIPYAAVAVDLEAGREVVLREGGVARAVAASSAVAGIFPPVCLDGRELIDGGYTSPVPVDAVRSMGVDVVVAVDVSVDTLEGKRPESAVGVAMRSSEICLVHLEKEQLRRADVVIRAAGRPRHWSDYSDPGEAIAAGAAAAESRLDALRSGLREHSRTAP